MPRILILFFIKNVVSLLFDYLWLRWKEYFLKMFDLFFSCSNLPDLCSDRALRLSGSFWARQQLKTLSHSLCPISSTSIKPFMNQFRLNNYAAIIWHIIMNNKHTQEIFNLFTDFTIYKQNTKATLFKKKWKTFFILNYTWSIYNQHQHGLSKSKPLLINPEIHFSQVFFYFSVSIFYSQRGNIF